MFTKRNLPTLVKINDVILEINSRELSTGVTTDRPNALRKLVSSPDPTPHEGKRGLGTLVEFLGILNVSSHVTITWGLGTLVEFLGILNVSSHVTITYSDPLAQRARSTRDPTARKSGSPQSK